MLPSSEEDMGVVRSFLQGHPNEPGVLCGIMSRYKLLVKPGIKAMTNRDSVLKSRDIILPTKVHIFKVMVSPVVMYGCESWTIKKPEH